MATVVAIITSMVVANATQSITAPNAAFISYNLVAGADSAAITPAASRSVLVMGCCTNSPGVGQVSLLHMPGDGMYWVGLEAYNGSPSTIASGHAYIAGTYILDIDSVHAVHIQLATADTILIHNNSNATRAGNVTLIW